MRFKHKTVCEIVIYGHHNNDKTLAVTLFTLSLPISKVSGYSANFPLF